MKNRTTFIVFTKKKKLEQLLLVLALSKKSKIWIKKLIIFLMKKLIILIYIALSKKTKWIYSGHRQSQKLVIRQNLVCDILNCMPLTWSYGFEHL